MATFTPSDKGGRTISQAGGSRRIVRTFTDNPGPVLVTRHEFGAPLEDYTFQITAKGLDTGTWSLDYRPTPTEDFKAVASGLAETVAQQLGGEVVVETLQITYAALGGGAAPVLTVIGELKSI